MPENTTKLSLPLIQPAQAQKHVTHNEAIRALDVVTQLNVLADDLALPPAGAAEGDSYLVPAGGLAAWAGRDGEIATLQDGTWQFITPRSGWRAHVGARGALVVFDGAQWADFTPKQLQNVERFGLAMQGTAASPFSAKLNAALWTALTAGEGGNGDLIQTLNKEAVDGDAGLLLQTGFVTRALIGLFGSDILRLAVSADGTNFLDGLTVDPASGIVDQPQLPRFRAFTNFDNWVDAGAWAKIGINIAEENAQGAFDAGTSLFTAPALGTYQFGASLTYKQDTAAAQMRARMVKNGTDEIAGTYGELSGTLESGHSTMWIQTLTPLAAGDTVELQASFRSASGYVMAGNSTFWGCKIG